MKKALFLFTIIANAAVAATAQDEIIRVETNLVTMNVAVTDRSGNYVRGLTKDDFTVMDEKARQAIEVFSAEDAALSIGIVYDMH